jgi:apolipoprotein N-acyltransferase
MTDVGNVQAGAVGTAQMTARPKIQVVPLKGLPIVAAVVVFVIAALLPRWPCRIFI